MSRTRETSEIQLANIRNARKKYVEKSETLQTQHTNFSGSLCLTFEIIIYIKLLKFFLPQFRGKRRNRKWDTTSEARKLTYNRWIQALTLCTLVGRLTCRHQVFAFQYITCKGNSRYFVFTLHLSGLLLRGFVWSGIDKVDA